VIVTRFDRRRSSAPALMLLLAAALGSVLAVSLAVYSAVWASAPLVIAIIAIGIAARLHVRTDHKLIALREVLDASPSGILCVDTQGVIQYANPTACAIFCYTVDSLVGTSVEDLIPFDIRARHPQLRSSFLKERRSRRMGEGRDIRGVTRDGLEIPLEIGLTFLGEGDNALIIVGVIDIRALKEAQEIINRQNTNLARSVRELEQFAFAASHDLREPLRKVMNYIEILQEDYEAVVDDDGKAVLNSMGGAVQRMEGLLDSLLNYSRITTKAQPFEAVPLNSILADVLEDMSLAISDAQAKIEVGALPVVLGDRNQLRQLFQNLISNSLKYHREDVRSHVHIHARNDSAPNDDKSLCCIAVSDNGIGFDNRYNELIFDVFKRLHGRDKYQGTGMGLAICRKIVERHEGFIVANGQPQQGAVFSIWLKQLKAR
jgi:PAS domain S-box-containing protein